MIWLMAIITGLSLGAAARMLVDRRRQLAGLAVIRSEMEAKCLTPVKRSPDSRQNTFSNSPRVKKGGQRK